MTIKDASKVRQTGVKLAANRLDQFHVKISVNCPSTTRQTGFINFTSNFPSIVHQIHGKQWQKF
jgi:hypothetical protein